MKKIALLAVLVLFAGTSIFYFGGVKQIPREEVAVPKNTDVKNLSYTVGSEAFVLTNGRSEIQSEQNSTTKNTLSIFGEPVYGDLNSDGVNDAAILLAHEPGGSGTFYYAVLAINTNGNYEATEAMFLGDRIAPQTVEIHDGRAVYNIAIRKGTDPMTTPPSIGQSVWIHYDARTNSIGEWVKDFEGESAGAETL